MYKSAARSQAFIARAGSFATHASRRGIVRLAPREAALDWDPTQFDRWYEVARGIIAMEAMHGRKYQDGTAAYAAFCACHFVHPARAKEAIKEVFEAMEMSK